MAEFLWSGAPLILPVLALYGFHYTVGEGLMNLYLKGQSMENYERACLKGQSSRELTLGPVLLVKSASCLKLCLPLS